MHHVTDRSGVAQNVVCEVEQGRIGQGWGAGKFGRRVQQRHVDPAQLVDSVLSLAEHVRALFDTDDAATRANGALQGLKTQTCAATRIQYSVTQIQSQLGNGAVAYWLKGGEFRVIAFSPQAVLRQRTLSVGEG